MIGFCDLRRDLIPQTQLALRLLDHTLDAAFADHPPIPVERTSMTLRACDTLPELLAGHSSPTLRSRTVPHELISGFPFWGHPAPVVAGFTINYTPPPSTAPLPLE